MDGEFDRELDDGGWGPNSHFKTAEDQLKALEKVVKTTKEPKDAQSIIVQMRKDVTQLLVDKGKTLKDKGSLLQEFWKREKQAKGQVVTEAEALRTCGWSKKGKVEKRLEIASKERRKWAEWAMWWQGASHVMKNKSGGEKPTSGLPKSVTPPPYAPSGPSAPPRSTHRVKSQECIQYYTSQMEG